MFMYSFILYESVCMWVCVFVEVRGQLDVGSYRQPCESRCSNSGQAWCQAFYTLSILLALIIFLLFIYLWLLCVYDMQLQMCLLWLKCGGQDTYKSYVSLSTVGSGYCTQAWMTNVFTHWATPMSLPDYIYLLFYLKSRDSSVCYKYFFFP